MLDETCGVVVECDDVDALEEIIHQISQTKFLSSSACIDKAKKYDKNKCFKEYLNLYAKGAYKINENEND